VVRITDKGIEKLAEIVATVRETVGWDVSLCIDHFGHGMMTTKEVIKLGKALEPYGLAWMEDPVPWWHDVDAHKQVTDAINVPTAAGEELYLWDGFREFIEKRAVDIIHPDLLTSGGMGETKRIADYAERYGIPPRCISPARRSLSWPTCTLPRPSPALWRSSTTASTCPSGRAW
jgi:L-alanine-DL-glutamate epimerase-like enolase superfamily enzyme